MNNKYLTKIKRFFQFGNRSFRDYRLFIEKAKRNGFEFVPLMEFTKEKKLNEKIIGLRHDVDSELNHALKIAKIEHDLGVQATYFVLHTASYFYSNISKHRLNSKLIEKLVYLQDTLGHEVGLHIDLMPIEVIFKRDPIAYARNLIALLRDHGINIVGVAHHGNLFHHIYRNKYVVKDKEIKQQIFADPYTIFDTKMLDVDYEVCTLPHDLFFSDADFIHNKRWDYSCIDEGFFEENGRTIILTHAIHWAPSLYYYFTVNFVITIRYAFRYLNEYFKIRKQIEID